MFYGSDMRVNRSKKFSPLLKIDEQKKFFRKDTGFPYQIIFDIINLDKKHKERNELKLIIYAGNHFNTLGKYERCFFSLNGLGGLYNFNFFLL